MKKYYLFWLMIVIYGQNTKASVLSVLADKPKVGFKKDTIRVVEGEKVVISISLTGVMPKDSIVVKYIIKATDATVKKDFVFSIANNFVFRNTPSEQQEQFFELSTIKDNFEEGESLILELSIEKGGTLVELGIKECVIILQDFKTPAEAAQEKFKEQSQSVVKSIQKIIDEDDEKASEVIGTLNWLTDKPMMYRNGKIEKNSGYKDKSNEKTNRG